MSRLLRLEAPWPDRLLAVVVAAGGIADVAVGPHRHGPLWLNVLALLVLAGLVAERRRARVATGYGFVAWVIAMSALLTSPGNIFVGLIGLLVFPYAIGSFVRGPLTYLYPFAIFGAIVAANVSVDTTSTSDWVFPTALGLAAYAAGRNTLHRTALAVELHEAALRAGEARDAESRRAVAAERRRIAHEMHDVVAHSISVMVVQAGGARRILDRDPARAEDAAAQIERTGRETLIEMRRLLGVMRRPDQAAQKEPNPNLDALEGLVARGREAGLAVDLRVEGARRQLRAGLELAAYRVVQDALNDVLRAAPTATTEVLVRWSPDALEISVGDDRPAVQFPDGAAPSLVGVRERVALYGGELRTGRRPQGGHEVHVRFPIGDASGGDPVTSNAVPAQGAA